MLFNAKPLSCVSPRSVTIFQRKPSKSIFIIFIRKHVQMMVIMWAISKHSIGTIPAANMIMQTITRWFIQSTGLFAERDNNNNSSTNSVLYYKYTYMFVYHINKIQNGLCVDAFVYHLIPIIV